MASLKRITPRTYSEGDGGQFLSRPGERISGSYQYLTFAMDDDDPNDPNPDADSIFKNIKIYEVNGSDFPVLDLDTSNSASNDYAFTFTEGNAPAAILNDISSTSLVDNNSSTFDKLTHF